MTLIRKKRSWRKRPSSASLSRSRLVAATNRTSIEVSASLPTGRTVRDSMVRSSLACMGRGMSPISSRNTRAALGLHQQPGAVLAGVGERAPLVAEQLALQQGLGHRGAVDGHERPAPPLAAFVQRLGDQVLARAALPRDEHGRIGGGRAQR